MFFMAGRSTETPDSLFNTWQKRFTGITTENNLMQLKQVEYHILSNDEQNLMTNDGKLGSKRNTSQAQTNTLVC